MAEQEYQKSLPDDEVPDPGPALAGQTAVTPDGTVWECLYAEDVDGPGRGQWAWRPLRGE